MTKAKIRNLIFLILMPIACFLLVGIFSFSNVLENAFAVSGNGGIMYVGNGSNFNMTTGSLSGGSATNGGGVYVASGGTFKMSGGTISGNSATANGGGVYVDGTFNMSDGAIYGNKSYTNGDNVCNFGTFIMTGGTIGETEGVGWIYCNEGTTTKIYGGTVLDNFYMYSNLQTKVGATIGGKIVLSDSNKITVEDYAGTTPSYSIIVFSDRTAGTIVTFKGNETEPDISKISISGYDSESYAVETKKDSSGNWTISLVKTSYDFPSTWKTEVASSTYMTTTVTATDLTSIKFVSTVPSGYTQIGTLSTGLPVYADSGLTNIAFVGKKIYAPEDNSELFSSLYGVTSITFDTFDTSKVTNMSSMFYCCYSLKTLDLSSFDTSKVTNMSSMFKIYAYGSDGLKNLDLSNFNTSNVTDMSEMFGYCYALNSLDLSNFDTSKVTDMSDMFQICHYLETLNLSSFDTSKVTNMSSMFSDCTGLVTLDVSNFNMSKVTSSSDMFNFGSSNKIETLKTPYNNTSALAITTGSTLYNEETGDVVTSVPAGTTKSLTYVNENPIKTLPTTWKDEVASSTYMTTTITATNLKSIKFVSSIPSGYTQIGTLSTGLPVYQGTTATDIAFVGKKIYAPVDSSKLFYELSKLTTLDMSSLSTSNVTNMWNMFYYCYKLKTLNISNFNTSKVTNMGKMFSYCRSLENIDLSSFDTSNVTDMSEMFHCCIKLEKLDLSGFNTSKVTNMNNMFRMFNNVTSCLKTIDLSSFDTSNVTDMSEMFGCCFSLEEIDLSSFNTSKVTNMSNMFGYCETLSSLNLNNFNTSNVTDMGFMFDNCSKLTSLNLSSFDTSKVTRMFSMFDGCSKLTSLDISNFDTSKVTNMKYMFYGCSSLTSLNLSNFDTSNVTNMAGMFQSCSALTNLDLSSFNMTNVTDCSSMLNFGSSNKIKMIKTPYNNTSAIAITTGSTLYNISTGASATGVSANTTTSQTLATRIVLTLDANGGSCSSSSVVGYYGCSLSSLGKSLPTPTQSGYTFNGWYSSTGSRVTASTVLAFTSSTTLTARWTQIVTPDPDPDPDPPSSSSNIEDAEYIVFTTEAPSGFTKNTNFDTSDRTLFDGSADIYTDTSGKQVAFVGSVGDIVAPQDCSGLFSGLKYLKQVIFRNYDTYYSTNFSEMFSGCESLELADFLTFQTPNVKTMRAMFQGCSSLKQIVYAEFDCINVTDMSYMFEGCASLSGDTIGTNVFGEIIPTLPNLKYTYNLESAESMFQNCSMSSFSMPYFFTDNLVNTYDMFGNFSCDVLDLSQFDLRKAGGMISGSEPCTATIVYSPRYCVLDSFLTFNDSDLFKNAYGVGFDGYNNAGYDGLIPFSICFVKDETYCPVYNITLYSGNCSGFTDVVEYGSRTDSGRFFETADSGMVTFSTYSIWTSLIYYLLPVPIDWDVTDYSEIPFAGWVPYGDGEIDYDGLKIEDFAYVFDMTKKTSTSANFLSSSDGTSLSFYAVAWGGSTAGNIGSFVSNDYSYSTPYDDWANNDRYYYSHIRYLPSLHAFEQGLSVFAGYDSSQGFMLDYYINITISSSGGSATPDSWDIVPVYRDISVLDSNDYWSFPSTSSTMLDNSKKSSGSKENVDSVALEKLLDSFANYQDVLIPEDKKVTITELKLKKVS